MTDSPHYIVVVSDGDPDYTEVYDAGHVTTEEERVALELSLPEDDGDYFYRVEVLRGSGAGISSFEELQKRINGSKGFRI